MHGTRRSPTRGTIALVNPNTIHPGVAPYALDILTTAAEDAGFSVDVVDLTHARDRIRSVLQTYFRSCTPLLVGVTIRNVDTNSSQDQIVFVESHREIIQEIRRHTRAPMVVGGAAFSSMPFALVQYFGVRYAVSGPGETPLVELASRLAEGAPTEDVEGLIINDGGRVWQVPLRTTIRRIEARPRRRRDPVADRSSYNAAHPIMAATAYRRHSSTPGKVDNVRYYEHGGLGNILCKNGCSFACAHCCEFAAKSPRSITARTTEAIVAEMEQLTGLGIHHLHATDSEFNFKLDRSKALLSAIIHRRRADPDSPLRHLRLWVYGQPVPFDAEYARLFADAGGAGFSFGTDHACDEILRAWKVAAPGARPYYGFEDARRADDWLQDLGVRTAHEFLFGMPGETRETIVQTIEAGLSLRATTLGFTLGIRLFPYQPLGQALAEESCGTRSVPGLQSSRAVRPIVLEPLRRCESRAHYERQFIVDEDGRARPLFYFSPDLPEPPEVLKDPAAPRHRTLRLIHEAIPAEHRRRVMLQPLPAAGSKISQTHVDNAELIELFERGYRGSAWGAWAELPRPGVGDAVQ